MNLHHSQLGMQLCVSVHFAAVKFYPSGLATSKASTTSSAFTDCWSATYSQWYKPSMCISRVVCLLQRAFQLFMRSTVLAWLVSMLQLEIFCLATVNNQSQGVLRDVVRSLCFNFSVHQRSTPCVHERIETRHELCYHNGAGEADQLF